MIVILLDNFGYAGSTTFGGVMNLPTIERLAKNGLIYNNFHTAPICSASRVALLTGRNPHSANMGTISEMATGFPGQTSVLPNSVAPLAKILRFNGYSTAMFGKSHEYVPWESGLTGPFDQWPTGLGFERFYGNVIGESDQFSPVAHDNTTLAPPSKDPNYYYQTDLADRAIDWIKAQKTLNPDKPFFVYYPAQGMHDPVQLPKAWRDKYKGKFDQGWDKYREEILARQKKLGIVPANTKLTRQGRHRAGLGHADRRREEGRDPLSGALRGVCRADRLRDRPGRPGHRRHGRAGQHPDHLRHGRQRREPQRRAARRVQHDEHVQPVAGDAAVSSSSTLDEVGGPHSAMTPPAGWSFGDNTPFAYSQLHTQLRRHHQWRDRVLAEGDQGERRDPQPVSPRDRRRPDRAGGGRAAAAQDGQWRSAEAHRRREHARTPSTTPRRSRLTRSSTTRSTATAASTRTAGTPRPCTRCRGRPKPRTLRTPTTSGSCSTRRKTSAAPSTCRRSIPTSSRSCRTAFMAEAVKYNVLPLDDRAQERFNATLAGRPDYMGGRTSLALYPGMIGMKENAFIDVKNRSSSITAELETRRRFGRHPRAGRLALRLEPLRQGRQAHVCLQLPGRRDDHQLPASACPPARSPSPTILPMSGGKPGAGGTGTLSINGKKVGSGKIERTIPFIYGVETADVGMDLYTPGHARLRQGRQPVHRNDQEGDRRREVGEDGAGI